MIVRIDVGPFDDIEGFEAVVDVLLAVFTAIPDDAPAPVVMIVDDDEPILP